MSSLCHCSPTSKKNRCPAGNVCALGPGTNRNFKACFMFASQSFLVLCLSQQMQFHNNTTHRCVFELGFGLGIIVSLPSDVSLWCVSFQRERWNPKFMLTMGHLLKPRRNVGPLCGTQQPRFTLRSSLESPWASAKWLSVIYSVPLSEQNCYTSLHRTNRRTKVVRVKQGADLWETGFLIASS